MSFNTPILFLIFNRPEVTQSVFDEIKKQKPKYLYVAADGARPAVIEDIENCKVTRDLVMEGVDWECEIKTLFREENVGCGIAVSEAITWFFENVEQGIILEDDCLPHPSFFSYCETLLERYKENDQVYAIGGSNLQNGNRVGDASYFFSNYAYVWGWASWRRAWNSYDFSLKQLEAFKEKQLIKTVDKRTVFKNYWISIFEKTASKEIDTWDYQWTFTVWNNGGLTIVPNVNLISNIGFGEEATHTTGSSPLSKMAVKDIGFVVHLSDIQVDKKADRYVSDTAYNIIKKTKHPFKIFKSLNKKIIIWIKKKFA